ncbi:hypothetical protein M1555_02830 [Patescibacteria group bacterium]|nr:hypothetical protein [Patescibacteria group bacterium]
MARKALKLLLSGLPLVVIYRNWFLSPFLTAADWPYYYRQTLAGFGMFQPAWTSATGNGLGGEVINFGLGSYIYFIVGIFVNRLGLPWELVSRILIFGLFLVVSAVSSAVLLRRVLGKAGFMYAVLAALLYTANTYILMIVDGGQMGVALAYSLAPLVIAGFFRLAVGSGDGKRPDRRLSGFLRTAVMTGIVLAAEIMFDVRIAIIAAGAGVLYGLVRFAAESRRGRRQYAGALLGTAATVAGLLAYWLLPIVISRAQPVTALVSRYAGFYSSVGSFRFFSFADFSHALALLHPNWPENIFGKTYFLQPEFLLLPIIAFASLLCVSKSKNQKDGDMPNDRPILFFASLGLLGAFLAKGASAPFGAVNIWLFVHLPLSFLFRDPTKFYVLTAVSYSMLIPFSLYSASSYLTARIKGNGGRPVRLVGEHVRWAVPSAAVVFLLVLIRPAIGGQLRGTFAKHEVPADYVRLASFLRSRPEFFRTLWVPTTEHYNFYTNTHPAAAADKLLMASDSAELIRSLRNPDTPELLANLSIQYVIVPDDVFGGIFVSDRRYDNTKYLKTVNALDAIGWLKHIASYGKIIVYALPRAKDHFWLRGPGSLSYAALGPSSYRVTVRTSGPAEIMFTDAYNRYWTASDGQYAIVSRPTGDGVNSFRLERAVSASYTVSFTKQRYYLYGGFISLVWGAGALLVLMYTGEGRSRTGDGIIGHYGRSAETDGGK